MDCTKVFERKMIFSLVIFIFIGFFLFNLQQTTNFKCKAWFLKHKPQQFEVNPLSEHFMSLKHCTSIKEEIIPIHKHTSYITHDPISINGKDDFKNQALSEGWPGNGTYSNPYVISGLYIAAIEEPSCLIGITNANVYFNIIDCILDGRSWGIIGETGIVFANGKNARIKNNYVINNKDGIILSDAENCVVSGNFISNNSRVGITLSRSKYNFIKNNILINDGFYVSGDQEEDYHQVVVKNNTVNGRLLVYWWDRNNEITPNGVGQVILINCHNIEISGQNLSHTTVGLYAARCSEIQIYNCIISNNVWSGIQFYNTVNSIISNSTISKNGQTGVFLFVNIIGSDYPITEVSEFNTIIDNVISYNAEYGIYAWKSGNNNITRNKILYNEWGGINHQESPNTPIHQNNISYNKIGIALHGSGSCNINENEITNSNYSGVILTGSGSNIISNNTIYHNKGTGLFIKFPRNMSIVNNRVSYNGQNGIQTDKTIIMMVTSRTKLRESLCLLLHDESDPYASEISNNVISSNEENGIHIFDESVRTISGNFIYKNKNYGVSIISNEVEITRNDFIENNLEGNSQALDNGTLNGFENNYWSDWSTPDKNSDGIIDIPYNIDGSANNQDNFPRSSPMNILTLDSSSSMSSQPPDQVNNSPMVIIFVLILSGILHRKRRNRNQ